MESALVFSLPKVVYFVTQVLTQEDWNTVMYDGMRATSKWAALYFILLMTIGNYILFNLLVAILVEGFANQPVRFFICPLQAIYHIILLIHA